MRLGFCVSMSWGSVGLQKLYNMIWHSGGSGDDDVASGLFLKLMEYTLEKDDKLANIAKSILKNAKYTSKDI